MRNGRDMGCPYHDLEHESREDLTPNPNPNLSGKPTQDNDCAGKDRQEASDEVYHSADNDCLTAEQWNDEERNPNRVFPVPRHKGLPFDVGQARVHDRLSQPHYDHDPEIK